MGVFFVVLFKIIVNFMKNVFKMKKLYLVILAVSFLLTSCDDDKDDNNVPVPEAGTLKGDPFFFVIDDGVADNVSGITIDGVLEGKTSSFVITDEADKILELPATMEALEAVNFEGVTAGDCFIRYIRYDASISGLEVNKNLSELGGVYDISNFVKIERVNTPEAGELNGSPFNFLVGDGVVDNVSGITNTSMATLSGKSDSYIITDDSDKILEVIKKGVDEDTKEELSALEVLERFDFDKASAGDCFIWYIRYEGNLEGLEKNKNASDIKIKEKEDGTKIGIFDLSTNSIKVERVQAPNAGELSGGPFTFTVGDGIVDNVSGITNIEEGTLSGVGSSYIITDDTGMILELSATIVDLEAFNFDGAPVGDCLIWYIRYDGIVANLEVGKKASDITGVFELSNSIVVTRN